MSLYRELKRRHVIRMAGVYLVGAWLIVQVAETVLPAFAVPAWVLRAVIIVLALGFVPAVGAVRKSLPRNRTSLMRPAWSIVR